MKLVCKIICYIGWTVLFFGLGMLSAFGIPIEREMSYELFMTILPIWVLSIAIGIIIALFVALVPDEKTKYDDIEDSNFNPDKFQECLDMEYDKGFVDGGMAEQDKILNKKTRPQILKEFIDSNESVLVIREESKEKAKGSSANYRHSIEKYGYEGKIYVVTHRDTIELRKFGYNPYQE